MDDHFWPSLYPGLIVGLLIGLGAGGLRNVAFGMAGGLAGSAIAYVGLRAISVPEGLPMLAATMAIAAGLALAAIAIGRRVLR